MATSLYIGDSFYPYSTVIKCSCGSHLIEIFAGKLSSDNVNDFGIVWYGEATKKNVNTDFYFKDYLNFKNFVKTLHLMHSFLTIKESKDLVLCTQKFYESIVDEKGRSIGGMLEVYLDEFGFVQISKYTYTKKPKLIWNFIISNKNELKTLVDFLENICITIFDKEYKKEEVNI